MITFIYEFFLEKNLPCWVAIGSLFEIGDGHSVLDTASNFNTLALGAYI